MNTTTTEMIRIQLELSLGTITREEAMNQLYGAPQKPNLLEEDIKSLKEEILALKQKLSLKDDRIKCLKEELSKETELHNSTREVIRENDELKKVIKAKEFTETKPSPKRRVIRRETSTTSSESIDSALTAKYVCNRIKSKGEGKGRRCGQSTKLKEGGYHIFCSNCRRQDSVKTKYGYFDSLSKEEKLDQVKRMNALSAKELELEFKGSN